MSKPITEKQIQYIKILQARLDLPEVNGLNKFDVKQASEYIDKLKASIPKKLPTYLYGNLEDGIADELDGNNIDDLFDSSDWDSDWF